MFINNSFLKGNPYRATLIDETRVDNESTRRQY